MTRPIFTTQIKPLVLCIFAALSLPVAAQAADVTDTIKEDVEIIELQGLRQAYRENIHSLSLETFAAGFDSSN
jgi:hypothetical protein|tara:strand:+ start:4656 stop:4874 length:219 start_codon:yes stop_codon:yes gene_type:complete